MGNETKPPKGIVSTEENNLRANGRRLRGLMITQSQRDRMEMAERYRAQRGLVPPTREQLEAAGATLPPEPEPRPATKRRFNRNERGSALGWIIVLILILIVLAFVASQFHSFLSFFHLASRVAPIGRLFFGF